MISINYDAVGASLILMASGGTAQTSLKSMMYANLGI